MSESTPFPPGTVVWSGENPGMYLKESEDGPFTSLVTFFRVDLSPKGAGLGVVLLEAPEAATSSDEAYNVCVTDNEPMARWLVENFISCFGAFRDKPGLQGMEYHRLHGVSTLNDLPDNYGEDIIGDGLNISLNWGGLSAPFVVDLPADQGATGKHRMYSLFADSANAVATVNGRRVKGRSFPRDFAGRQSTTAFLAFAETWVLPE